MRSLYWPGSCPYLTVRAKCDSVNWHWSFPSVFNNCKMQLPRLAMFSQMRNFQIFLHIKVELLLKMWIYQSDPKEIANSISQYNYVKSDFNCYWLVRVSTFTHLSWANLIMSGQRSLTLKKLFKVYRIWYHMKGNLISSMGSDSFTQYKLL